MIAGLGIDLVSVSRIRTAMRNPRFVQRILTERERLALGDLTAERLAGRWAIKEAAKKAYPSIGSWHDVEALPLTSGGLMITIRDLPDGLRAIGSITHERDHAAAVVIIERVA